MYTGGKKEDPVFKNLLSVIYSVHPSVRNDYSFCEPNSHEVYPGIYVGNIEAARDRRYLQSEKITHVLNAAEGNKMGMVNTNQEFYLPMNITYHGIKLMDVPTAKINVYFDEAIDFIDQAMSNKGKVLVHCLMGRSRSATFVVCYLMKKKNMCAPEALALVRRTRDVRPNDGFLQRLSEFEHELRERSKE